MDWPKGLGIAALALCGPADAEPSLMPLEITEAVRSSCLEPVACEEIEFEFARVFHRGDLSGIETEQISYCASTSVPSADAFSDCLREMQVAQDYLFFIELGAQRGGIQDELTRSISACKTKYLPDFRKVEFCVRSSDGATAAYEHYLDGMREYEEMQNSAVSAAIQDEARKINDERIKLQRELDAQRIREKNIMSD